MENASKALIMAAGVLIGMLIISLAVYLFVSFGSTSAQMHKQNEEQQIAQFNNQFTSYEIKECTIYDVVTVANLATENNIYYELKKRNQRESTRLEGKDNYIAVEFKDGNMPNYNNKMIELGYESDENIADYYNGLISEALGGMTITSQEGESDLTKYKCEVEISETTQRVCKVTFSLLKR